MSIPMCMTVDLEVAFVRRFLYSQLLTEKRTNNSAFYVDKEKLDVKCSKNDAKLTKN